MVIAAGQPVSDDPLNQGMLHWWMGLPGVSHGPNLIDVGGFADGVLTNGPTWDYDSNGFNCLRFDGTNDYVTMGDVADVEGVSQLTVHALINPNTLSGGTDNLRYIVAKEDGGGFVWILRQLTGGDKIQWYVFDGSVRGAQEVGGLVANTWNLVTATFKAGVGLSIYRNGIATSATGFSGVGTLITNSAPLAIGSLPSISGRAFSGLIGDVRIQNRYTTADEAWVYWQQSLIGNPLLVRQVNLGGYLVPAPPAADPIAWVQNRYHFEYIDG